MLMEKGNDTGVSRGEFWVIMACAVLMSVLMLVATALSPMLFQGFDTFTYHDAMRNWSHWAMDPMRVPVYPLFMRGVEVLCSRWHLSLWIVLAQNVVFLFSVAPFLWLARRVAGPGRLSFWLTMCYAAFPCMLYWNDRVMTESLAIVGTVLLLSSVVKAHDTGRVRHAVVATVVLVLLLFMRPASLFLLPVVAVAWLLMAWKRPQARRVAAWGVGGVVAAVLMLMGYMVEFHRHYGVITTSYVGRLNTYDNLRRARLVNVEAIGNAELRALVASGIAQGDTLRNIQEPWTIIYRWGPQVMDDIIASSLRGHYLDYACALSHHVVDAAREPMFAFYELSDDGWIARHVLPPFWLLYVLVAAHLVATAIVWWRGRQGVGWWLYLWLTMVGFSALVTILVGAQDDYCRLVFPFMPAYLLMAAQLVACWKRNKIFGELAEKQ